MKGILDETVRFVKRKMKLFETSCQTKRKQAVTGQSGTGKKAKIRRKVKKIGGLRGRQGAGRAEGGFMDPSDFGKKSCRIP
jgi:hypothetical protein